MANLRQSRQHYISSMKSKITAKWQTYASWRKSRLQSAEAKLACMHQQYTLRRLMRAWVEDYKEARRAKKYFERREEGGEDGGEDIFYWPEGEDPISALPSEVALLVRQ